jgi:hypothetical protein
MVRGLTLTYRDLFSSGRDGVVGSAAPDQSSAQVQLPARPRRRAITRIKTLGLLVYRAPVVPGLHRERSTRRSANWVSFAPVLLTTVR